MDQHDKNLKNLANLLKTHRPEPTPLQLDEVKRRVMGPDANKKSSPAWAGWRARFALASIFVLAFAVNAFGVPKAATTLISTATKGTQTGNSSMVEYCPKDNPNHQQC